MIHLLYSFGLGLAFAGGLLTGFAFAAMAIRRTTNKDRADTHALNVRIQDRLEKYVANTARIAEAIEKFSADQK